MIGGPVQSRILLSFLAVAEQGNITRAADTLNISQPALTKSMQKLEDYYGVKLFERVPSGVELTRFGEILLSHVKVMDNEHRHAVARIKELRDGRTGGLRIGAGPVWLVSILPPLIAEFQQHYPNVSISLIGGVIDTLLPDLINGDLDLVCVSLDFPNQSEVVKQPLFNIHHVLVATPSHPLADGHPVTASRIHEYPWMVLKSDYVGTERISSFFAANGLKPPRISFETTSIHSLLQGLKNGSHIAHIPVQMLPLAETFGLQKIELTQTIWETTAGYAWRASAKVNEPMRGLMRLLDNYGASTASERSTRVL